MARLGFRGTAPPGRVKPVRGGRIPALAAYFCYCPLADGMGIAHPAGEVVAKVAAAVALPFWLLSETRGKTMSKLLDLMRRLASDAALADAYHNDPKAVLEGAGLSAEEQRAMLEKDYDTIKALTGLKDGQYATNSTVKTCDDQGYDDEQQGDGDNGKGGEDSDG